MDLSALTQLHTIDSDFCYVTAYRTADVKLKSIVKTFCVKRM